MTRTVFCTKYQADMEAMARPPYPGAKGQTLFETLSKQAWQAWLAHQTMLINEKQLNMMDPESRSYLQGELDKFISGEDYDQADGYVPPSAQ